MRMKYSYCSAIILSMAALLMICGNLAASEPRKLLITADELHTMLAEGKEKPVILEVGWGGPEDYYNKGHIPSSIHMNTDIIEYDEFNQRSTTPEKKLGRSTTAAEDQIKGSAPKIHCRETGGIFIQINISSLHLLPLALTLIQLSYCMARIRPVQQELPGHFFTPALKRSICLTVGWSPGKMLAMK